MTPILTFEIQTVPDIAGLRSLHGLDTRISDHEVAEMVFQTRRQLTDSDAMPAHLQRVVAIACTLQHGEHFKVWSLGDAAEDEAHLIQRFFDGIEKYSPQLVSRQGSLSLSVLHLRGLIHGVQCQRYWEMRASEVKLSHATRYLDLMDLLALQHTDIPLNDLAKLIGLPSKQGLNDHAVWTAYQNGQLADIRHTCETDVLNTALLFTRFQMMRGILSREAYQQTGERVRSELQKLNAPHLNAYLAAWTA